MYIKTDAKLRFLLLGGDLRSLYLARLFAADGHNVARYASEQAPTLAGDIACADALPNPAEFDCVVLPLPASGDGGYINAPMSRVKLQVDDVLAAIPSRVPVAAGKVPRDMHDRADSLGLRLFDYLEREELAIANAIPTAEGAIAIAMEELPITLHGASALVVGYGRIGKYLCRILAALGAKVTASARKYSDLAWIRADGHSAARTAEIGQIAGDFDVVFNTVPTQVVDADFLAGMKEGAPVIDLASSPGGVDRAAAQLLGVKTVWALSLPGKVAPLTSGAIIRDTIYNILDQWRCGGE